MMTLAGRHPARFPARQQCPGEGARTTNDKFREDTHEVFLMTAAAVAALSLTAQTVAAADCDDGEIVIKFSHVTNTDKHPKGIAASLLQERVNEEMDGKACMEVYPELHALQRRPGARGDAAGRRADGRAVAVEVRDLHQGVPHLRPALHVQEHRRRRRLPDLRHRSGDEGIDAAPRPAGPRLLAQRHEAVLGQQAAARRPRTPRA